MTDLSEKLNFLLELIKCNLPVGMWHAVSGDDKPSPIGSTSLNSFRPDNFSSEDDVRHLKDYLLTGNPDPVILEYQIGLLWIVGFTSSADHPSEKDLYFLGPFFSAKQSRNAILQRMDQYSVSLPVRRQLTDGLLRVAIMPFSGIAHIAVILHKCLTDCTIPASSVETIGVRQNTEDDAIFFSKSHNGVYIAEKDFLRMIREGDSRYAEALKISATLSAGVRFQSGDSLRKAKNNALVLLTLVSRAAIEGGMDSATAYDMNDAYAERIEACQAVTDLAFTSNQFLEEFVSRVRQHKVKAGASPQILRICDYIRANLFTPLTIQLLAKRCGYSEYYFSRRFSREMGVSVRRFILDCRLEKAHDMILTSNMTISEIEDSLCFDSRSYFIRAFREKYGCTPVSLRSGKE